jgi:hypothetical protein
VTFDAKSISGNIEVLGAMVAIDNANAIMHQNNDIKPPIINKYNVTGAMTNYRQRIKRGDTRYPGTARATLLPISLILSPGSENQALLNTANGVARNS